MYKLSSLRKGNKRELSKDALNPCEKMFKLTINMYTQEEAIFIINKCIEDIPIGGI